LSPHSANIDGAKVEQQCGDSWRAARPKIFSAR
jgi:hypothetical protein